MKILLDESLPKRLKIDLKGHQVKTVPEAGWQGKKNGELLRLMDGKFDIFMTADQNLKYQLNLRNTTIRILVFKSASNRYQDLQPLVQKVFKNLDYSKLKNVTLVE